MTAGVGLFGTFTAYVATFFLDEEHKQEESEIKQLIKEVRGLKSKLEAIESRLNE